MAQGLSLFAKRLEKAKFAWPTMCDGAVRFAGLALDAVRGYGLAARRT